MDRSLPIQVDRHVDYQTRIDPYNLRPALDRLVWGLLSTLTAVLLVQSPIDMRDSLLIHIAGYALLLVGPILTLAGIGGLLTGIRVLYAFNRLSVTAQAIVIDCQCQTDRGFFGQRRTTCKVMIEICPAGQTLALLAWVSAEHYSRVKQGARIGVRYQGNRPQIALLEGERGW